MFEKKFEQHKIDRLAKLISEIISITGPGLDGNLPPVLYNGLRRYCQTYCVDGVPVLNNEPAVVLSLRGARAVLPNFWWMVGGRVPKGQLDETKTLESKFKSELGVDVAITEDDYIGRGRLVMMSGTSENPEDYIINTPTSLYAVGIPNTAAEGLISGDGNERWNIFTANQIAQDETLHPYVRLGSAVAIDRIHGTDWRKELDLELRNIGYPGEQDSLEELQFIPLQIQRAPIQSV